MVSGFRVWLVVLLAVGAAWVWWRVGQSGGERLTTFACATDLPLLRFTDGVPGEWLGGANEAVVTAAFRVSDSGAPESVTVTGPTDAIRSQVRARLEESRFDSRCRGRSLRLRYLLEVVTRPVALDLPAVTLQSGDTVRMVLAKKPAPTPGVTLVR